jgi:hypothetical protein
MRHISLLSEQKLLVGNIGFRSVPDLDNKRMGIEDLPVVVPTTLRPDRSLTSTSQPAATASFVWKHRTGLSTGYKDYLAD